MSSWSDDSQFGYKHAPSYKRQRLARYDSIATFICGLTIAALFVIGAVIILKL